MASKLEHLEQVEFHKWLKDRYILHGSISNESVVQKNHATGKWEVNHGHVQKRKAAGWNNGIPDMIIGLRAHETKDGKPILLFAEMKKEKGGALRDAQKTWLEFLSSVLGVKAERCNGAKGAIEFIEKFYKKPNIKITKEDEVEFDSWLHSK